MSRVMTAEAVQVDVGTASLEGDLHVPVRAAGLVIFVHGSGSGRFSSRNRAVARALEERGHGTLLLDLLTRGEEARDALARDLRFDVPLLGRRVVAITDWIQSRADLWPLPIAFFGASTGAAAALIAAATRPEVTRAVISRGGRPDLAGDALTKVVAPTLLIVGSNDVPVLELNRSAMRRMRAAAELKVVEGATHLFEEPGALEQVSALAADWCDRHLRAIRQPDSGPHAIARSRGHGR
jgi:putative phosphoribosyl transferase